MISKNDCKYYGLISPTNGTSRISLHIKNFITFSEFCNNLNLFSSFATGRSQVMRALVYCYLMYYFVFFLAHSRTTTFLSGSNQPYSLPVFLIILINRFFIEVQSFSRTNSNINGRVECDLTFGEMLTEFANISERDYHRIISDTPFSGCSSNRDFLSFRSELEIFIQTHVYDGFKLSPLCKDNISITSKTIYRGADLPPLRDTLHNVLLSFPYFKSMFYRPDNSLSYAIGDFSNSVSRNIGIHRFRRAYYPGRYASNAFSLNAIKGPSLDDMVCFLCVFRPTFYEGVEGSLTESNYVVPGDSTIDVSAVTTPEILLMLFSFSQNRPIREGQNGNGDDRPVNDIGNHQHHNNDNGNGDSPLSKAAIKRRKADAKRAKQLAAKQAKTFKGKATPDAIDANGAGKLYTTAAGFSRKPRIPQKTNSFEFGGKKFVYTNPFYSQLNYSTTYMVFHD